MAPASPAQTLEERFRKCLKFDDDKYYLNYQCYFDVAGMVHSVVLTKEGSWVLRIFRGQEFGPKKHAAKREANIFRVTKEIFHAYIVKPDPHVGKIVDVYGKNHLLEIVVYDEHRESLKRLSCADFVAVQNVHHSTKKGFQDTLIIHGGDGGHNRGISVIPDEFSSTDFWKLEVRIYYAFSNVKNDMSFVEFEEEKAPVESTEPIAQKAPENSEDLEFAKPWNKIVLGDTIAVDYFIKSSKCEYHFLTHAHTDHCRGIDLNFKHKIYCSQQTADILPTILGLQPNKMPPNWIIPMKENTVFEFAEFSVTAIDANHVHGAVMFVFEGPLIKKITQDGVGRILCTGDFRGEAEWIRGIQKNSDYDWFLTSKYSRIYLDNTYFSVDQKFLTWNEAAESIKHQLNKHPDNDFYIPLHRLGREKLIEKVSLEIGEPIELYEEKLKVASKIICETGVDKKKARTIRVVKRNVWRGPVPEGAYVMEITQIHHLTGTQHTNNVIHIPYSDHSSRQEILDFLSLFDYDSIYPSSRKYSKTEFKDLMRAGIGFTEQNLEKQLKLHSFATVPAAPELQPSTSTASPLGSSCLKKEEQGKQSGKRSLPQGVVWQNEEYEYMDGDLDTWPEGPPKNEEEAIYRMSHRKRRRV